MKNKLISLLLVIVMLLSLALTACAPAEPTPTPTPDPVPSPTPDPEPTPEPDPVIEYEVPALTVHGSYDYPKEYTGEAYVTVSGGVPLFTVEQIVSECYEHYSEQDSLGRCGVAVACLGTDLLPTEDRGSTSGTPTGWQKNSIYERSHLIAWSLAGENSNKLNLITGTYSLNGVMQEMESLVLDYIKETGNHVMYRVTPVFEGNNLLASGVVMEALSVEDEGEGVCFSVYIYNAQPDYDIDYATGVATVSEDAVITQYKYVLHATKNKIHLATCKSVQDMSEKNKIYSNDTLEDIIAKYESEGKDWSYCGNCHPELNS